MQIKATRTAQGLAADEPVVGSGFWDDAFIERFAGERTFTLRPGSCRVLSLRSLRGRPQLVSTSRHVSQGVVDVRKVRWSARQRALSGVSQVIGGEAYELGLWSGGTRVCSLQAPDGVEAACEQDGPHVRVRLLSTATGDEAVTAARVVRPPLSKWASRRGCGNASPDVSRIGSVGLQRFRCHTEQGIDMQALLGRPGGGGVKPKASAARRHATTLPEPGGLQEGR